MSSLSPNVCQNFNSSKSQYNCEMWEFQMCGKCPTFGSILNGSSNGKTTAEYEKVILVQVSNKIDSVEISEFYSQTVSNFGGIPAPKITNIFICHICCNCKISLWNSISTCSNDINDMCSKMFFCSDAITGGLFLAMFVAIKFK